MLARNEHREEVVAILEYLAQNDLMTGVREKAQGVLDAQKATPTPQTQFFPLEDRRHIFQVTCMQCGQINYFDKRQVCAAKKVPSLRGITGQPGKTLDEMDLPCGKCGHTIPTRVDCEGY